MPTPIEMILGLSRPGYGNPRPADPGLVTRNPRNNVEIGAMRKALGLGAEKYMRSIDPHDPFSSQVEDAYDYSGSEYDTEQALKSMMDRAAAQEEAKGMAEAIPERVRGEYTLAGLGLQGKTQRDVAGINREAAASNAQASREFTAGQNTLQREAVTGRVQMQQQGATGRGAAAEAGKQFRQKAGQNEGRAKQLETGKIEPNYPPTNGVLDSLKSMLGLGAYDRTTAAKNEATSLRQQNSESAAGPDVSAVAQHYATKYPGLRGDQLAQLLYQEQPDASPEEIQAVIDAIEGVQ